MKPLQPLSPVPPEFVALLEGLAAGEGHPAIVADWLVEHAVELADVLLLYARDLPACEGMEEMACPCGFRPLGGVNRNLNSTASACPKCAEAGREGGVRRVNLWPLLPCAFPQDVLVAWAGQVYGQERAEIVSLALVTHPKVVRSMKRHTLRLFPEVTRRITVSGPLTLNGSWLSGATATVTEDIKAEDFVPPEPEPQWGNNRIQLLTREPLRAGDIVRSQGGTPIGHAIVSIDGEQIGVTTAAPVITERPRRRRKPRKSR